MKMHSNSQVARNIVSRSVLLTVLLALTTSACGSSTTSSDQMDETEQTIESTVQPDASTSSAVETTPVGAGVYIQLSDYQASKDSYAQSKVVLFFNATWCSTCKKARSNLEADLTAIPSDLAIVLVDFDSETDLKRKYGVTVQHTFVQIDADGNELAKWSGSLTAQKIAEKTV
jgi:thiol-disulfide isomerase/thioredoxin